jgi:hypothetical protein
LRFAVPFLVAAAACTPSAARRPVDPTELKGVTLGIPPPADARRSPGIGCGQISQDLALRAHKLLIASFSDAGANATNASTGKWVLTVALRQAVMGPENAAPRPTDRPIGRMHQPDMPPLEDPQAPLVNSGNGTVDVVLEGTLSRDGQVVFDEMVDGHASSAPCVQVIDKVREALADAVDRLRERVAPVLRNP